MRRLVPLILGAAGVGFFGILMAARKRSSGGKVITYETPAQLVPSATSYVPQAIAPAAPAAPSAYVQTTTIPKQLSAEIVASARKWATKRGLPLQEVLATILVESQGKPRAHAKTSKEDSYGLMQVNVNAWKSLLTANGMTVSDLYDIDKNIMLGTYIYAMYRQKVQTLLANASCPQSASLATLTRLYYKGPAYVEKAIKATPCQDASHPYKQADQAVANWNSAMAKVSAVA
jgi:hypothetical protein